MSPSFPSDASGKLLFSSAALGSLSARWRSMRFSGGMFGFVGGVLGSFRFSFSGKLLVYLFAGFCGVCWLLSFLHGVDGFCGFSCFVLWPVGLLSKT